MDKKTYILGAGFSRYAGLPLMNDFYFKSKDIYPNLVEDDKKSFDKVFEYFDDFSKVKHIMNADFYNIEELLSIIEMDAFIHNETDIKDHYLNYLKTVIENLTPKEPESRRIHLDKTYIYSKFLCLVYNIDFVTDKDFGEQYYKQNNFDNGIISLNYDLLLENSLKKINKKNPAHQFTYMDYFDFNYGLDPQYAIQTQMVEKKYNTLKLAKLHGSVNFVNKQYKPLIVPPTWNKTSNDEMIPVWEMAHKLISQANELVFIGYSLPITDLYVKYLLISGIKSSYNLKKITVICPDDDKNTIKNRYENFFDENFRNKAFEYVSKKFEDYYKDIKITDN